ncbi:hypothetical protein ADLECEL_06110 [Adlercreutzia equolifaciens subsp. celatus]|uniref:Type I restriction modification DNA specificity domain-containing protein n=2 Tax=Adlercreutzia equolifaciens TaxID=446660 RepID=A0A3N0ALX4_9ACTN|nr:restriction endonuclease subunit S [Adlercreutzia equolifaciens]RFT91083.1 restriction endonuclease subunit S [Adlercreutzia equolifaciens subsp. celatus]RNL35426.1 hypothetical protein DMP10_12115 [Adlercreutzia equolifaciens subsp. celatus DSM 18785]BCS56726.1 hypothetical protein ADLECEL_06110 [Adlercreutzia equolifaciens subsp. celatus]
MTVSCLSSETALTPTLGTRSDVGTSNVVETHDEMAFYVSLALLKPRNIESYFLNSAIKSSFFQKGLQERTLVTAVPKKINKDEIGKVEILLPVAIEEQRQIGAFFRSLDSLIALHQRERVEQFAQSGSSFNNACKHRAV